MGALAVKGVAASAVCRAWRVAWEATRKQRRELHRAPLATPDFEFYGDVYVLAALPGDRLCIESQNQLHIVDTQMRRLQVIGDDESGVAFENIGGLAASDSGLYVGEIYSTRVLRLDIQSFDVLAEVDAEAANESRCIFAMATAPEGLLFVLSSLEDGVEVLALDALSLERRHAFGRQAFSDGDLFGLAVAGQELIVGNAKGSCLHVFSFSGEHLRKVHGDWIDPFNLCCVEDRIYLVATERDEIEESGGRIFVLSPQGEVLHVYSPEKEMLSDGVSMTALVHVDGRLIVATDYTTIFALQGL